MAKKVNKKNSIHTVIDGLEITVTTNNIHIKDSYTVTKRTEIRNVLNTLEEYLKESNITMDNPFNHRSINSMVNEWIAHNNLYILNYKREQTGSVDLNHPQPWYMPILYWLFSRIVL